VNGRNSGGGTASPTRAPWPAASRACGCGVLVYEAAKGRHGKTEELTVSSMEAFAASGRAPKRVVDGGHDWREKRRAGEDVSGQNKAKTRIGGTYVFAGSW